jgi:hypothetical protein
LRFGFLVRRLLGVNDERDPQGLAFEQEWYDKALGRLGGFHRVVRAGDYRGDGEHAVVGEIADFRLEIARDHVAEFAERIAGLGGLGGGGFAKHQSGEAGGGKFGAAYGVHAAERAG